MKNAGSLEYIPKDLDIHIKQALESANEANLTKDELEAQHKRKEFISVQRLAIMKAKNDGIEQGIEQEKINIAKNLLDILDNQTISLKTGLDITLINTLRE